MIRPVAIAIVVCALAGAVLSRQAGREITRDISDCRFEYFKHGWFQRDAPACAPTIIYEVRPATNEAVTYVLLFVACFGLFVTRFPRRSPAAAWTVSSAVAGWFGFISAVDLHLRPRETVVLWTRIATWSTVGLVIVGFVVLLGVMLFATAPRLARARVIRDGSR